MLPPRKTFCHALSLTAVAAITFSTSIGISLAGGITLDDLVGEYGMDLGTVPGLEDSAASVKVEKQDHVAKISWKMADGTTQHGIGVLYDDVMGVSFGGTELTGLAIYKVEGGTLTGKWIISNYEKGEPGMYTMTGPEDLNGTFNVVTNDPATGGKATFTPKGKDVYGFKIELPSGTYSGVAVKCGHFMIAVNGTDDKFGAAAYICEKGMLTGYWATPKMEQIENDVISKE